jgi:hypothetical protein
MESNGKRVDRDGAVVDFPTCPVVWGGVVLSGAFPFALGSALALLAIWALQSRLHWRFALLTALCFAASPLAFLLLVVLLAVGLPAVGRTTTPPLASDTFTWSVSGGSGKAGVGGLYTQSVASGQLDGLTPTATHPRPTTANPSAESQPGVASPPASSTACSQNLSRCRHSNSARGANSRLPASPENARASAIPAAARNAPPSWQRAPQARRKPQTPAAEIPSRSREAFLALPRSSSSLPSGVS